MSTSPKRVAQRAYSIIEGKANANSFVQGLTGITGFPLTLIADAGSLPLVYHKMWNELRSLYGHSEIEMHQYKEVVPPVMPEVLGDLVLDKALGQVPIVGIYFNAICAKALTWRLGTLFAFLSSRGDEVPLSTVTEAMGLIRRMFPQRDMFKFTTPEKSSFVEIVTSVGGLSPDDFDERVHDALAALRG